MGKSQRKQHQGRKPPRRHMPNSMPECTESSEPFDPTVICPHCLNKAAASQCQKDRFGQPGVFVCPTCRARIEPQDYAAARARARCAPQALDPSPAFFRGQLMPFQREGAAYLVNTPRALLAAEMGLGKTVQARAAVAELQAYPLRLVVPPHLVTNWQREIRSYLRNADGSEPTVHVLRGLKPYDLPCAQIYIVHYLLLRGWKQALPKLDFAAVIFDEIQELRHSGTEKYSAASLVAEKAPRVIGLSGTPIYNRGGEIWNVINILDFHALGDWESFTREWCYGYGNNIVAKPELLGETLREEGYMQIGRASCRERG